MNTPRASFDTHWHAGVLVVIDLINSTTRAAPSVTNDAEAVTEHVLRRIGTQAASTRIIYRDSDGRYDELRHDGARFTGFGPLNTDSEAAAVAKVMEVRS